MDGRRQRGRKQRELITLVYDKANHLTLFIHILVYSVIRISFQTIYGKLELVIAVEGWLGAYVCKSLTGFFHQIESKENVLLCDVFFIAYTLLTSYQSYFHN